MQAQTIDQNYANGILFMAMSTIETLESKVRDKDQRVTRDRKEFGSYDRHDYSAKEVSELKGQLRNNVMLLANSKMAFELTYDKGSYQLPTNYDMKKVLDRLEDFRVSFDRLKENDCKNLVNDIIKILDNGIYKGLFYEQMVISDPY